MELRDFQQLIRDLYLERDTERGLEGTWMWFSEEVGELCRALRRGHGGAELEGEFADVCAWLFSLASMAGVDMEAAVRAKYLAGGVPGHTKDADGVPGRPKDADGVPGSPKDAHGVPGSTVERGEG